MGECNKEDLSHKTLQYYNYFNGYDLQEGLEAIKPDFIVTDYYMEGTLFEGVSFVVDEGSGEPRFPYQEFQQFLASQGVKQLEFVDPWHGRIRVYQIDWNKTAN